MKRSGRIILACISLLSICLPTRGQNTDQGVPKRDTNERSLIMIGPNVLISKQNSLKPHAEVRIAADHTNARRLLACSMLFSKEDNALHTIVYVSVDGGASWRPTLESDRETYSGDPDCVFGLNGTAYFVYANFRSKSPAETLVYRSRNGGFTWQQPVSLPFIDREYLTIDQTSGSYRGHIYLHGNAIDAPTVDGEKRTAFRVFRSLDEGQSFFPTVTLLPDRESMPFASGNGVVLSDGTFVALFPEWSDRRTLQHPPKDQAVGSFKVVRSESGGETFSKAVVVSTWNRPRSDCVDSGPGSILYGMPSLAADNTLGPFRDRLYAVWSDKLLNQCVILFSYSPDKGRTWSPAKVISDEPEQNTSVNHHMPVVAVNNKGVLGISWYDGRSKASGEDWWTRFIASYDGGETFLKSVVVSEKPQAHTARLPSQVSARSTEKDGKILTTVRPVFGEFSGGDTAGMAADINGVFHALWVDNRTGVTQVWTSAIEVEGAAVQNGEQGLASLADVSQRILLELRNTNINPATGQLSFDATLRNNSKTPLIAPINLRVIALKASTGNVQITNSDNQMTGVGAVWSFSDLIGNGSLKPGEQTQPKRLVFRLANPPNGLMNSDLLTLEIKVLARK